MPVTSTRTNLNDILPALHHALCGATGTAIATCTTYPLSLVLTRLQAQRQLAREGILPADEKYEGIIEAFSRICAGAEGEEAGEGWKALYTGLTQDVTKSILDSFLFFLFYELFQSRLRGPRNSRGNSKGPGVLAELVVGVAAGACSRALTTPIATIVAQKQTAALVEDQQDSNAADLSVWDLAAAIRREKGLAGLWSGYSASLVLTLNPSLTFFLQEFLKRALLSRDRWDEPGSGLTFLLAAVSKAVASSVTYPFQIAKARLQVSTVPASNAEPETDAKAGEEQGGPPAENGSGGDASASRDVEKEVEAKLSAVRAVQKLARRSIFGTLVTIAREEGVAALYDGLPGELLKGFFSHGTTMLAKDVVHKLLFKLYLLVVGVLREVRLRKGTRAASQQQPTQRMVPRKSLYDDDEYDRAGQDLPRALQFRNDFPEISRAMRMDRETPRQSWGWFLGGGGGSKSPDSVPDGDAAGFILNVTDPSRRKIPKWSCY
ncbi:Peroxisomal adenine nucleotide transporter 1 [Apiospora phragmitis]|uniref:Peroxisomal adenine nucleotide transporter 1 n=1 Tax=Apiospora phragmitis TaxID=2905665 RepID=A0ABR1UJ78_9PEZI